MSLAIEETHINETKGYLLGEPVVTDDPFTDDVGEIFRFAQKEYGRCQSKIYVDTKHGTKHVGWVFSRKDKYEDADEYFTHEVWVTLLDGPPIVERKTTLHYID